MHSTSISLGRAEELSRQSTPAGLGGGSAAQLQGMRRAGEITNYGKSPHPYNLLTGTSGILESPSKAKGAKQRIPQSMRPNALAQLHTGMALGQTGLRKEPAGEHSGKLEYRSHQEFKQDMHKHRRKVHNPVARSSFPMTSSQEYGWSGEMIKDNNLGEHNRRSCRETRFQQHIALGPRHKSGYGGQGGVL